MSSLAQTLFNFSSSAAFHQEPTRPYPKMMRLIFFVAAEGRDEVVQTIRDLEALSFFDKGQVESVSQYLRSEGFTVDLTDEKLAVSWKKSFL